MNWDRFESSWAQFAAGVYERRDNLTDRQPAGRVEETHGMTNGGNDAQRELADRQHALSEIKACRALARRAN